MSILIDKNTQVITQGITGKTGQFHTRMCRDYANGKSCFVAGVNPKKAGEDFEGIPIYATVKDAQGRHRRDGQRDLRAAGRRRRGDLGGGGGRARPRDLHHRRHPGARHARGAQQDEGQGGRGRQEDAAARPQLPGPDHARRDQDRHHARPHPPQGPHRRRQPLGHAHLRGGRAAHRDRPRPVERGRHRRRPDQRPEAHRRDEAVQRRPGHRRGRS